jgi:PIN domain nuclease of toxin-antitoxin system
MMRVKNQIMNNIKKNSPQILTGIGVSGLIGTAILAAKGHVKAVAIMKGKDDILSKKEIIKETWTCYVPSAVLGSITIASIISINTIHTKRATILAGAYTASQMAMKEYKDKVKEILGDKNQMKVRDAMAEEVIKNNPIDVDHIIKTDNGEHLCYDPFSGRYFRSSVDSIQKAINKMNKELLSDDIITLNQLYYELGLSDNIVGEEIGWLVKDGLIELDFSTQMSSTNEPCIVMNFFNNPSHYNIDY